MVNIENSFLSHLPKFYFIKMGSIKMAQLPLASAFPRGNQASITLHNNMPTNAIMFYLVDDGSEKYSIVIYVKMRNHNCRCS